MSGARLALYWLIAGAPLAWGVWHTLLNVGKLLH